MVSTLTYDMRPILQVFWLQVPFHTLLCAVQTLCTLHSPDSLVISFLLVPLTQGTTRLEIETRNVGSCSHFPFRSAALHWQQVVGPRLQLLCGSQQTPQDAQRNQQHAGSIPVVVRAPAEL